MTTLTATREHPAIGIRASRLAPVIIAVGDHSSSERAFAIGRLIAGTNEAVRQASSDDPAAVARLSHESSASLIVCGLRRPDVIDRMLGDDVALQLIRHADVPVLAVANDLQSAPRRILVACDFSETSVRAARVAVQLAAPNATIFLAHVAPVDHRGFDDEWDRAYRAEALEALRAVKGLLQPAAHTVIQEAVLHGDANSEILRFAELAHADLIATGSHGYGFVTRLLVGSVATRILRAAPCSVLTVPHTAVMSDEHDAALREALGRCPTLSAVLS